MKPEKFIGLMLLTLALSCEMQEQTTDSRKNMVDQKIGEVFFKTNQYTMTSSFEIDIYIDGNKVETNNESNNIILSKNLEAGIHSYEIKIYTYNGQPSKTLRDRFMIQENKTSEVFVDFKKYNSWK